MQLVSQEGECHEGQRYQGHQLPPVTHLHWVKNNNKSKYLISPLTCTQAWKDLPATSIILQGKPVSQLESSDVSCKKLPLILPQSNLLFSLHLTLQSSATLLVNGDHLVCARGIPLLEITSAISAQIFIIDQNIILHRDCNIYEAHVLFWSVFSRHKLEMDSRMVWVGEDQ